MDARGNGTFLENMRNSLAWVFEVLSTGLVITLVVSLVAGILVTPWDLLVWLTKSDWRTTHFILPAIALPTALVCWPAATMLSDIAGDLRVYPSDPE